MIDFACETCGKRFRVADELAGRKAKCKECGSSITIPSAVVPVAAGVATAAAATAAVPAARPKPAGTMPNASEVLKGSSEHFAYEISQRPDFAMLTVSLPAGKQIFAEPSAMMTMTPSVELKAGFKGGLGKTIGRALGGESLIINTFTATKGPGEVAFAPGSAGDILHYSLSGRALFMQRGSFLAYSEGVELTGKWQGAKGFFSGEGLVLLKATGTGDIFFNSYGAILAIDVTDEYFVDTGYVVAFEESLDYKVTVLPGLRSGGKLKSFFFGGEGFVCRFSGQGRVWIQTRHVHSFLSWVNPFRPAKSS